VAGLGIVEAEALHDVDRQQDDEQQREVERVAVQVLDQQRPLGLAAVFGPWRWPWIPFIKYSPAMLILVFPLAFRMTCYYYRGAYYKAFWADPPNCAVGEPREHYRGEQKLPLIVQNLHRYALYFALLFIVLLSIDVVQGFRFNNPKTGHATFGIGIGSIVLLINVVLIAGYTLGCHSFRHLVGGIMDTMSRSPARKKTYDCVSCLNRHHPKWAWFSLVFVGFTDVYVRLCSMGVISDLRII
jgi:hypothetical protein